MPGIHHHSYGLDVQFEVVPNSKWPTEDPHAHHTLSVTFVDTNKSETGGVNINLRLEDLEDLGAVVALALGELEEQRDGLREENARVRGDIP